MAHGFNIHFQAIRPPAGVNVFMVAPKGPGHTVRALYEQGRGVPCADRDRTRTRAATPCRSRSRTRRASARGRAGIIETNFRDETETDLFGEQTVLCGGLTALMQAGYETLSRRATRPRWRTSRRIHEVKLIVDLIYEGGVANMRYSVSNTAEYGDFTRGPRVIDAAVKAAHEGDPGRDPARRVRAEFILENRSGQRRVQRACAAAPREHPMEEVGARLRALMPWLKENRLVDRSKN